MINPKILFIGSPSLDYLQDCIYHGLKVTYNPKDIYSNVNFHYMYQSGLGRKHYNYGMGFTIACNLPDSSTNVLSNSDIIDKIKAKFFDYIFYGSIHRCSEHINLAKETYPADKIIIFDGEDAQYLHETHQHFKYFKRELNTTAPNLFPISFSVPKEKFLPYGLKTKRLGTIIPCKRETYIFRNEADYYKDYNSSLFGITHKKSGWDCMRHYEVALSYCLPLFEDIRECPAMTMTNWPKDFQIEVNEFLYDHERGSHYRDMLDYFYNYSKNHFTTEHCIQYIFSKI